MGAAWIKIKEFSKAEVGVPAKVSGRVYMPKSLYAIMLMEIMGGVDVCLAHEDIGCVILK